MDTAGTDIPHRHGIVLVKYVLYTKRPLDRLRRQLIHDDMIACLGALCCDIRECSDASRTRLDPATAQIIRNVGFKRRVNRSAQLWRQREDSDVVIQDIIRNTKTCADGSRSA